MKIVHETKDTLFITELSSKEIDDIKNLLSESKPEKISVKDKKELKKCIQIISKQNDKKENCKSIEIIFFSFRWNY